MTIRVKCYYCGGEGNIAGEDGLEQCELCEGEGEIDLPKRQLTQNYTMKENNNGKEN